MRKTDSPSLGKFIGLLGLALLALSGCTSIPTDVREDLRHVASPPLTLPASQPLASLPTATPKPTAAPTAPPSTSVVERAVRPIPLSGPAAQRNAELSGMDWYGEMLVLLPQYPDYFTTDGGGVLFAIPKADILAYLEGSSTEALEPLQIPFSAPGLAASLPGFEGYEGIAFDGDRVYLTIEVETRQGSHGFLVSGWIAPDLSGVAVDTTRLVPLPNQSGLGNKADEALIVTPNEILTLHEVNALRHNPAPIVHRFDKELFPLEPVSFVPVEYRVTDATQMDEEGRFWVINYYFPGDEELATASDSIAEESGRGSSHELRPQVERLVEFRYDGTRVVRTDAPPIQLALTLLARNWEGLARLDERGFLLATDQFPETVLGFVATCDNSSC